MASDKNTLFSYDIIRGIQQATSLCSPIFEALKEILLSLARVNKHVSLRNRLTGCR